MTFSTDGQKIAVKMMESASFLDSFTRVALSGCENWGPINNWANVSYTPHFRLNISVMNAWKVPPEGALCFTKSKVLFTSLTWRTSSCSCSVFCCTLASRRIFSFCTESKSHAWVGTTQAWRRELLIGYRHFRRSASVDGIFYEWAYNDRCQYAARNVNMIVSTTDME